MDKLKEQFKQEFEKQDKPELSFDLRQLEPNTKKTKHIVKPFKAVIIGLVSAIGLVISIPATAFFVMSLRVDESVRLDKRNYAMNDIQIAESNTFKKLNNIDYPHETQPLKSAITAEEEEAYASFSKSTYRALVDTSRADNMSYSVVGLYSIMNELTCASSRDDLSSDLNSLLGLDENARVRFYDKVMKANSFVGEKSTTQLKNAAFFNNRYEYNDAFLAALTKLYCEAYQLSFENDAEKIVDWVNQAVNSKGFIDKSFLELTDENDLYLFSTLYFKNAWADKYISDDNVEDDFHLADGSVKKTMFMRHSYFVDHYYDYGTYISFQDFYFEGNASITYLIPKKVEDDIFALTKNSNIFAEKEENKVFFPVEGRDHNEEIMVSLKTPKFKLRSDVDFKPCLTKLGFESVFDWRRDSFKNAFSGEAVQDKNAFVETVKQRNEVEFNEDGSIVKSVSMAGMACGAAAPIELEVKSLTVELNQPFIYIIRDVNGTPIFVGHVDNPTF